MPILPPVPGYRPPGMLAQGISYTQRLSMDAGAAAFIMWGMLTVPDILTAISKAAAAVYKEGAPGEFA